MLFSEFIERQVEAVNRQDLAGIAASFHVPFVVSWRQKTTVVMSEHELLDHLDRAQGELARIGFRRMVRTPVHQSVIGQSLCMLSVKDTYYADASASFGTLYLTLGIIKDRERHKISILTIEDGTGHVFDLVRAIWAETAGPVRRSNGAA